MTGATEIQFATATATAELIRRRAVSPVEVLEAHLRRIEECDDHIHAFVILRPEKAMEEARAAERAVMSGQSLGPLHGVPVAIKDEGHLAGEPTSYGMRSLRASIQTHTGPDVARLRDAGVVIVGKTNLPEFGHKGVTDNRFIGPTSTPFDLAKNAGGSSGGSAAAVGACFVPLAQGGDGGGSIRIPAALSGVYGLKPSMGRVPTCNRPDAYAFAMPMTSYGPLARTVADAALMLQCTAGPHSDDPLSLPAEHLDYVAATERDMTGRRIAFWPDFGGFPVSAEVADVVRATVEQLGANGLHLDDIGGDLGAPPDRLLESWRRAAGLSYAVLVEDLRSEGLADLLGDDRVDLSPSFLEYLPLAGELSAVDHLHENALRSRVYDRLEEILANYDFIVTPTLSVAAVANVGNGDTVGPAEVDGAAIDPKLGWSLCFPVNFAGHPAASIPAGFTPENHPVGLQVIGRRFREDEVLGLSGLLERIRPWYPAYRERLAI